MKKLLLLIFFGCITTTFSQRKYSQQIGLNTDNDLYTSTIRDGYYTSGLFVNYKYLSSFSSEKITKRTYEFEIGQQIYTPYKATVETTAEHDRPFAGYLFGSFGINSFYKTNEVLQFSAQIGVLGPSSLAEETMEIIHDIYGFRKADGWRYQISEAFALNFEGNYIKYLGGDTSNKFDISWVNNAKIGTVFTDFSTGLYGRIGFQPLTDLVNSVAFGGNFNDANSSLNNVSEFFIFIKPTISYVAYDATIEGSFLNDDSPITYDVKPFKFMTEVGIRFTANRFNFGYSAIFHTKKLKNNTKKPSFYYGNIHVNYQFN